MTIFIVKKYNNTQKTVWNTFVSQAKNATFLFYRDFMEYHQDRFEDYSLMVYKKSKLIAVFPANKVKNTLYSHQGLSYGGLILDSQANFNDSIKAFKLLLAYCKKNKIKTIHIKLVPKIYQQLPSDEMDYFLFLMDAILIRRDISSTIDYSKQIKIQSNRIEGKKKAIKQGLSIKEETSFETFWNQILTPNLKKRHQTKPVHLLHEIELLHSRFPKNIRQFNVYKDLNIVAGATIFDTKQVAHVQYMSANNDKQKLGSLDFLFEYLINEVFNDKKYFDFGISNINQGRNINQGLQFWKEGFGARSIVHDFYEIDLSKQRNLDSVFI